MSSLVRKRNAVDVMNKVNNATFCLFQLLQTGESLVEIYLGTRVSAKKATEKQRRGTVMHQQEKERYTSTT